MDFMKTYILDILIEGTKSNLISFPEDINSQKTIYVYAKVFFKNLFF